MAEFIGLAASILELTKTIESLRNLCLRVKNAPEEILGTINEINHMKESLSALHAVGTEQPTHSKPAFQGVVAHCRQVNNDLSTVVARLQDGLGNKKIRTRVVYAFKKSEVEALQRKLERSKTALMFALQIQSLLNEQSQRQGWETMMVALKAQEVANGRQYQELAQMIKMHPGYDNGNTLNGSRGPASCTLSITMPLWLWSRVWQFCIDQAGKGWQRSFSTHREWQDDHPAFDACEFGDVQRVNRLLCSGEIALEDQNRYGETLFLTACKYGRVDVARFLHSVGARVDGQGNQAPLYYCWQSIISGYQDFRNGFDEVRSSVQFLTEECNIDLDDLWDAKRDLLWILSRTPDVWTSSDLVALLFLTDGYSRDDGSASFIRHVLGHRRWHVGLWSTTWNQGQTPLHAIANSLSLQFYDDRYSISRWTEVFGQAIRQNADFHARSTHGATPLMFFLFARWPQIQFEFTDIETLTSALQQWVRALLNNGVDIAEYGAKEAYYWTNPTPEHFRQLQDSGSRDAIRIFGFTYGKTVKEWSMLTDRPGDRFSGEFWLSVDSPEYNLPGAWIDESDHSWDDVYFNARVVKHARRRWYGRRSLASQD